jgi:hypothetical protein
MFANQIDTARSAVQARFATVALAKLLFESVGVHKSGKDALSVNDKCDDSTSFPWDNELNQ